ncbi:MAG: class I SAM-dependent methyltransferase [Bacteroidota bacterium]
MDQKNKIIEPAEAFDKSAKIYQDKFMDVSLYQESFKDFNDQLISDHSSILDIACGPGNIIKYILNKRPEFEILGIDISPKMLALARENNPTAQFEFMDCRQIDQISKQFDGITCGFCLPYLTIDEAVKLISNVSGLLKPGGVFYLSTMEEDAHNKSRYQTSGTGDLVYVNYHKETILSKVLSDHRFEILSLKRFLSPPTQDGLVTSDLVYVAKMT